MQLGLGRVAHLFGLGRYWRLQGIEGDGLDTLGKGGGRQLTMGMVEVTTCRGMALSMHHGRVPSSKGVQGRALRHARNLLALLCRKMVGQGSSGALDSNLV